MTVVWLLFKILRDRPGILRDISSLLASRNINIRNYLGNIYAGILEADAEQLMEADFAGIKDIRILAQLPYTFEPVTLDKSVFMHAIVTNIRQFGFELETAFYRVGFEYGKEFVRRLGGGPRETIDIAMHLMTAFNVFRLREIRGYEGVGGRGVLEVLVENPFDVDINLSFTKGYIHGVFTQALAQLFYLEDVRRVGGNAWAVVLRPL